MCLWWVPQPIFSKEHSGSMLPRGAGIVCQNTGLACLYTSLRFRKIHA